MKSSFVILMSLIICSLIYPQDSTSNPKYALSFGIADNFRLDRFNMDIAVKKIIDESNQFRLFLSPKISSTNQENERSGSNQSVESKSFLFSLGLGVDYLWILMRNEDINMFTGTGLVVTYGNRDEENTSIAENGDKSFNERSEPFTNVGIRGTLGVEWKVSEKIGIHSEYLLSGSYEWRKSETKSSFNGINSPTTTSKYSNIYLTSFVLFGVSIYL